MNLILQQFGYPPALLPVQKRLEYYSALETANNGDIEDFEVFVAKIILETLENMVQIVG